MSKDVEDIFLQLSQIYFITIRTQSRDFIMIKDPVPHHIYLCYKSRVKPNLFKPSETYISTSSEGEHSSSSISSISDNSDAFSKFIICRDYNIYISTFAFYIGITNIVKFERASESKNFHKPKSSNQTDLFYWIHLANPTKLDWNLWIAGTYGS